MKNGINVKKLVLIGAGFVVLFFSNKLFSSHSPGLVHWLNAGGGGGAGAGRGGMGPTLCEGRRG